MAGQAVVCGAQRRHAPEKQNDRTDNGALASTHAYGPAFPYHDHFS